MDTKVIKGIQSDLILQAMAEEDGNVWQEMNNIIKSLDKLLTMNKTLLEQVTEDILNNIDFEGIREAMFNRNWVWARSSPPATPTVAEMKEEVTRQIENLWASNIEYTSCGGFTTTKYVDKINNTATFKVAFELSSYESDEVKYD
jgi:hypothetical protein